MDQRIEQLQQLRGSTLQSSNCPIKLFKDINRNKLVEQQVVGKQPIAPSRKVTWSKDLEQNKNLAPQIRRRTTYEPVDMELSMPEDDIVNSAATSGSATKKSSPIQEIRDSSVAANAGKNDGDTRNKNTEKSRRRGRTCWWLGLCNFFEENDFE